MLSGVLLPFNSPACGMSLDLNGISACAANTPPILTIRELAESASLLL